MVQVRLKNPTLSKLKKVMKDYSKDYKSVELKYNYQTKTAILNISRKKH